MLGDKSYSSSICEWRYWFKMTFLLILIILFYIVFGIVDVRFGFLCKKEQRKNKTIAQIYVGTKKIVWILGTIFFLIGILEVLLLLFSFNIVPLYVFLVMCIAVQWGFATFLWNYFCYSAVFMNGEKIYFYHKRKKQEISLENIAEIKAAFGNVAYTFFDENNNMLFEVQMKKENAYQLVEYIKQRTCTF